jgi:glycogen debranching enzyme
MSIDVPPEFCPDTKITWREWSDLIQSNFEKKFWVNPDKYLNDDPKLVNQTQIYKDTVDSSQAWTDYQLRPNQVITMVVVSAVTYKCNL